nr:ATP-binding protein [uncultured Carboxylicivirga sp.]
MKIKNQLFLWFSVFILGAVCITTLTITNYFRVKNSSEVLTNEVNQLNADLLKRNELISKLFTTETVNDTFFITKKSKFLDHKNLLDITIQNRIDYIVSNTDFSDSLNNHFTTLKKAINQQDSLFILMVDNRLERGYKNYGKVGLMRDYAHQLEEFNDIDPSLILMLRRREKDFIIRHEYQYVQKFNDAVQHFKADVSGNKYSVKYQQLVLETLFAYKELFKQVVQLDNEVGFFNSSGLKSQFDNKGQKISNELGSILNLVQTNLNEFLSLVKLIFYLLMAALTLISLWFSFITARRLTKPIVQLNRTIQKISLNEFRNISTIECDCNIHEIKILTLSFNQLLSQLQSHESERNILIEKLKSSEDKYKNLANKLPQSIYETNKKGRIRYVNNFIINAFGYTEKEFRKLNINDIILKNKVSKGTIQDEILVKRKDGSWFPGLMYEDDIIENGVISGKRGVIIDISERYKYLKLLKKQRRIAQETDALKSAFMANVSHEVRTPLNSIQGFSSILQNELELNDKNEKYFQMIDKSVDQLLDLFNDILSFSELKSDQLLLSFQKIKLADIYSDLVNVCNELQEFYSSKNLSLEFNGFINETLFVGDKERVMSIFRYLIDNAFKFSQNGTIRISARISEKQVVFEVQDEGIGVDIQNHELIFEPFRQVNEDFTRSYQGSGIGLSLAKGLITIMNGDIRVNSEIGKGATFSFSLPLVTDQLKKSNLELLLARMKN